MEIILHLGDRQVQMVRTLGTSQAIWDFLRTTFEHTDLVYQVTLIKRLLNMSMDEGQSATKFVDEWQTLLDEVIVAGLVVPTQLQSMFLLAALPPTWRAFITTQSSVANLQLQTLVAKILQEEVLSTSNGGRTKPIAMMMGFKPTSGRRPESNSRPKTGAQPSRPNNFRPKKQSTTRPSPHTMAM